MNSLCRNAQLRLGLFTSKHFMPLIKLISPHLFTFRPAITAKIRATISRKKKRGKKKRNKKLDASFDVGFGSFLPEFNRSQTVLSASGLAQRIKLPLGKNRSKNTRDVNLRQGFVAINHRKQLIKLLRCPLQLRGNSA